MNQLMPVQYPLKKSGSIITTPNPVQLGQKFWPLILDLLYGT